MNTPSALSTEEVLQRGRLIYDEKVRPELTEDDRGKFVEIDILTGDWVMDKDDYIAGQMAKQRFGLEARRYVHRVGYQTPYTLGFPLSANREPI